MIPEAHRRPINRYTFRRAGAVAWLLLTVALGVDMAVYWAGRRR